MDRTMTITFGDVLKAIRRRRGLSQHDLAMRSGVSARAIGSLENGSRRAPYRSTIERLSSAMGLTPDERVRFESAAGPARRMPRRRSARGAESEHVETVCKLLRRYRLVTITGRPTASWARIAAAVATRFACGDAGATVTIECTAETTTDDLVTCIANAASTGTQRPSGVEGLIRAIADRRLLVVLRHGEDAMPAVAPLVNAIVGGTRGVVFLAMSPRRLLFSFEGVHGITAGLEPTP